ncbi:class I SAM-dependent DNA methyltransferase [Ensifer sp. NPDC090286]|uniref:class I SAM-dependent DNA methyltransferase n=1 Tax=Ensifer sp. NPDC090286 TaxID=3363991 RepID=UPI00383B2E59
MTKPSYDQFADVYDRLMGDISVRRYSAFVTKTLSEVGDRRLKILDLACGPGRFASFLLEQGHEVTGVDLSPEMLARARANAPLGRFEPFDMNAPTPFERKFDAVICLFDSINHLLSLDAVTRLFENVRKAILPGGLFLFDVNTADGFAARWKGGLSYIENDLVVAGSPRWNGQTLRGAFALAWFKKPNDAVNFWTRHDAIIEEAAYSDTDLSAALKHAGFGRFQAIEASQDANLPNEEGRTFWVAYS